MSIYTNLPMPVPLFSKHLSPHGNQWCELFHEARDGYFGDYEFFTYRVFAYEIDSLESEIAARHTPKIYG